ncbi:curli production assembly/transport component CsgF [Sediminicola luteus]|uniref:Curli production assembly/transport component CsgF n=1 Tax=Sediminicola luteus TaxID=319238 RepID=A0A2A4G7D3_9FLAO|nr:curli production assembly/transport component CsgF [Sediminicola luteus]PCE64341.1 curli assembly protein CsgF [Sediminicola luteus]
MKKLLLTMLFVGMAYASYGQQLVYTPKNPNFGGNTFNYQWLLSSANAQNTFGDPNAQEEEQTELEKFQEDLNRQLLGQLTRSVFNSQLGDGLQPGTFTIGTLSLEIFDTPEGLLINILDTNTGEQTQIIVPK